MIPEITCMTPEGMTMPYHPIQNTKEETIMYGITLYRNFLNFIEVYGHIFDPKISKYTSYVVYASNKINWKDD